MTDKFWLNQANDYSEKGFDTNELGTHPELVKTYNKYCLNAIDILDYGCGDGSLMKKINNEVNISLYDISPEMLKIAEENLTSLNAKAFYNVDNLPKNQFDCIFISMVFICVSNPIEFEFILKKIKEIKKEGGHIIVANPHPCFRDKIFSSYFTEYSEDKEFNYFNEGDRHKLTIRDKDMSFYDFNWSVSFLINTFIKFGFDLVNINEINDVKINRFYNENHSPTIIYTFK